MHEQYCWRRPPEDLRGLFSRVWYQYHQEYHATVPYIRVLIIHAHRANKTSGPSQSHEYYYVALAVDRIGRPCGFRKISDSSTKKNGAGEKRIAFHASEIEFLRYKLLTATCTRTRKRTGLHHISTDCWVLRTYGFVQKVMSKGVQLRVNVPGKGHEVRLVSLAFIIHAFMYTSYRECRRPHV